MMKTCPILLLFISSSFIAASSEPPPPVTHGVDPKELISESCTLASKFDGRFTKDYCVSSLNGAQFNRVAKMSMHELASIGLNLLYKNVSATKAKIELLAHGGPVQKSPALREALHHCGSMYNEANHRIKDALKYMETRDYKTADRTVSMVQGDGTECEAEFSSEGVASPFTKENSDTEYLGAMATLFIRFFDRSYTPWGLPVIKNI